MTTPGPPRAQAICATDDFLRARARTAALTAVTDHLGGRGDAPAITRLAAEDADTAAIAQGLTPDLFGGTPVLVLTDTHKATPTVQSAITAWITAHATDGEAYLVADFTAEHKAGKELLAALKAAKAHLIDLPTPKGAERRKFAAAELRRMGLAADSEAERMLAETEPDLRGIATRAHQLSLDLAHTEGTRMPRLSAEQVTAVASSAGAASGFAVADALMTRDPAALTAAIEAATLAGTAPILMVSSCLSALRDLAAVQQGTAAKMPPWKAQKVSRHTRRWDPAALAAAIVIVGGAHPALGHSGRRDADICAALLAAITT